MWSPLVRAHWVHPSQSVATPCREVMIIPASIDIVRADEPLELLWRQLFTIQLPFQLSNDLFHVAYSPY
jgi:hypothetical protein